MHARLARVRTAVGGFTLIEVIVALVVVSLGMLAVIQAVGQTASNTAYLREKTLAHWVAMNRLTEVRLQRTAPPVDKTSDEVEMAGRRWRWTMTVTQTPVETIRRIDIRVRDAEADEDSSLATVTGFYGTAIAPPGSTLVNWESAPEARGPEGPGEEDEELDVGGRDEGEEVPSPPEPDPELEGGEQ
ncbi:MAG TPA: type II secretion system minor pseudopilin GspI [Steroidobacter sp.]